MIDCNYIRHIISISFLVLIFSLPINAKEFVWMIETGYTNTPDFVEMGFSPIEVVYEQDFYSSHRKIKDRAEINEKYLAKVEDRLSNLTKKYVVLDIEQWLVGWEKKDQQSRQVIVNRYVETISRIKKQVKAKEVGYFRVVPAWINPKKNAKSIQRALDLENRLRKPIADEVDIIYPSLYTYHSDPEKWKKWAFRTLNEAKKIAPGKKIIPFLMPRFHPSSKRIINHERKIPADYWRMQLDFVFEYADGVVIWDGARGGRGNWKEDAIWWQEVKSAIGRYRLTNNANDIQSAISE